MLFLLFINLCSCSNIIFDYATTSVPNITKEAYFYNTNFNSYIPINNNNLENITSYLTINFVNMSNTANIIIDYYKKPQFLEPFTSKCFNKSWLGIKIMNEFIINQWFKYSNEKTKSPTFMWNKIIKKCFNSDVQLYTYVVLVPSNNITTFLYTFSWKYSSNNLTKDCTQSIYELNHNKIICFAYDGVNCNPPF